MKANAIILLLFLTFTPAGMAQNPGPLETFADQINAKWKTQDDDAIQSLVESRLQANPDDILALGVKTYFCAFVKSALNKSRAAVQRFNSLVQTSSAKESSKVLAQAMKDEIFSIPTSEDIPLSPAQLAQLHGLFPNAFPMLQRILLVAQAVSNSP